MRRVLVAQSVGLWIRLNRHLSGVSAVDLVETPTLENGLALAHLERPAVVVLGRESGIEEAERLLETLLRSESAVTRVVFASDDVEPSPRPLVAGDSSLVTCSEEELVSVVSELLAAAEEPRPSLDLLVHYRSDSEREPSEGFVVVLDLDEKSLLLQADEVVEIGRELSLDFFAAASAPGMHREKVSLVCVVESCRDEADLSYHARISRLDAAARAAIRRLRGGGES